MCTCVNVRESLLFVYFEHIKKNLKSDLARLVCLRCMRMGTLHIIVVLSIMHVSCFVYKISSLLILFTVVVFLLGDAWNKGGFTEKLKFLAGFVQ